MSIATVQTEYERFTQDISQHAMAVLRDDGLYRHLRFSKGDSYHMRFDLVTWPGYLCYTGDMGTYVFTRLPDMFEFFRRDDPSRMDRGYWAEKCVGLDRDGIMAYSEERFRAAVKDCFESFVESESLAPDKAAELWGLIEDEVLSLADNKHDAISAAMNFRWATDHVSDPRGHEVFPDFWEHRLDEYTPRFIWCCYALAWAIQRYDKLLRRGDERRSQQGLTSQANTETAGRED